jgi:hypothetical protein
MHKLTHIVVIKLKPIQVKKVLNVLEVSGDKVVHAYHLKAFAYKFVTKMRA